MIPALLSCVFVIYLYRMLQDSPEGAEMANDQPSRRLAALQRRVDQLTEQSRGGQG